MKIIQVGPYSSQAVPDWWDKILNIWPMVLVVRWWRHKRLSHNLTKAYPQIIVVGKGPPKRSAVQIIASPSKMPKWVSLTEVDKNIQELSGHTRKVQIMNTYTVRVNGVDSPYSDFNTAIAFAKGTSDANIDAVILEATFDANGLVGTRVVATFLGRNQ